MRLCVKLYNSIQGTLDHLKRVIDDDRVKIIPRSGSKEPDPARVVEFILGLFQFCLNL